MPSQEQIISQMKSDQGFATWYAEDEFANLDTDSDRTIASEWVQYQLRTAHEDGFNGFLDQIKNLNFSEESVYDQIRGLILNYFRTLVRQVGKKLDMSRIILDNVPASDIIRIFNDIFVSDLKESGIDNRSIVLSEYYTVSNQLISNLGGDK